MHRRSRPGGLSSFVSHQEINPFDDEPLECVVARSGQQPIVVNLDIDGVAQPEHVPWVDAAHPAISWHRRLTIDRSI